METDTMEMDYKMLKGEFDRFLGTYNEDSTLRSSREAFDHIVSLMQQVALRQEDIPCPGCGGVHGKDKPLSKPIFIRAKIDEGVIVVAVELRTKKLLWVNKTREQMKEEMRGSPSGMGELPPEIMAAFLGSFVIRPSEATLEDLAGAGIRPFHMIQWLRVEFDHRDFVAEAHRATQHMADA